MANLHDTDFVILLQLIAICQFDAVSIIANVDIQKHVTGIETTPLKEISTTYSLTLFMVSRLNYTVNLTNGNDRQYIIKQTVE